MLSVASELHFTKQGVFPTDDARSIAERVAELVRGPVVAGLHSLAAASLAGGRLRRRRARLRRRRGREGARARARGKVVTGRALDAGPLASARALEGMTAVIVNLNRRYKGHAGVRVVGLP